MDGNPIGNRDPLGLVTFELERGYKPSADIIDQANAVQDALRKHLSEDTKKFFKAVYGVDIAEYLKKGSGPRAKLRGTGDVGECAGLLDRFLYFNANYNLFDDGGRVLGAALLHELTHHLHHFSRTLSKGSYPLSRGAKAYLLELGEAFPAVKTGAHISQPYLAEYYQYETAVTFWEAKRLEGE